MMLEKSEIKKLGGLYIRVSTDDQSNSIAAQKDRLLGYCKYNGIEVVDLFVDEGVSGGIAFNDRYAGKRVIESIACKRINCIIATKLDRLFRNTIDSLLSVDRWEKQKVSIHLSDMGGVSLDTSTANGKFFFTMLASSSQYEKDRTSERVKEVSNHKKSNLKVYASAPLGFDIVGRQLDDQGRVINPGDLVVNEKEKEIVGMIFNMRREGRSMQMIADELNSKQIPSKNNSEYYASTIKHILGNSIYSNILKTN